MNVVERLSRLLPAAAPRRPLLLGVALYLILHVALRLLISDGLYFDEAEQQLLATRFAWGYHAQPPLYTWLQMLFIAALGHSPLAFLALKYFIALLVFAITYQVAKVLLKSEGAAIAATLSLVFFPEIGWEWLRERTHLILATFFCAATALVFLRLAEKATTVRYLLFGLAAGLGLLAKYNYAVFLAAFCAAGLAAREYRHLFYDRRMILSALTAAAVILPHAIWVIFNFTEIRGMVAAKIEAGGPGGAVSAALMVLFKSALAALPALLAVRLLAGPFRFSRNVLQNNPALKLFSYYFLFVVIIMTAGGLATGGGHFKTRWAQPFFVFLPIYLLLLPEVERRTARISPAAAALAVVFLVVFHARTVFGPAFGHYNRANDPLREISAHLPREAHDVVAANHYLGGNLSLWLQDKRIFTAVPGFRPGVLDAAGTVLVWNATVNGSPPAELLAFARERGFDPEKTAPLYLRHPYRYSADRDFKLGVLRLYCPTNGIAAMSNAGSARARPAAE